MDRNKLNYWIDVGLAVSFVLVFITGIIKFPILVKKFGVDLKSLPMKEISFVHDWSGLIMGILVLVHLVLHWKWIVAMTKNIFKKKQL